MISITHVACHCHAAKESRRYPRSHMKLIRMRTGDKKAKTFRFDTGSKNNIIIVHNHLADFLFDFLPQFDFYYTVCFFSLAGADLRIVI